MQDLKPSVGVSIAVFRGREVLLIKRDKAPFKGCWSLPGGSIDWGESAEAAAIRELAEETRLLASSLALSHVSDAILRGDDGKVAAHFTIIVFATDRFSGIATPDADAGEVAWCGPESRSALEKTPDLEIAIQRAEQALYKDRL